MQLRHLANNDGVYFVGATARRPHRVINGFVFLRVIFIIVPYCEK